MKSRYQDTDEESKVCLRRSRSHNAVESNGIFKEEHITLHCRSTWRQFRIEKKAKAMILRNEYQVGTEH